jgi:hypothetical protein
MNVPYTTSTGVKIGSRYNESPKPMPIDDLDMILLQGWLIQSPEWHFQRKIEKLVYRASMGVFLIIVAAYVLVAK